MAPVGGLKRFKILWDKFKKIANKTKDFVKDKVLDMAIKSIKFLKSGKLDLVLNIVKSFIPQAAVATEIVDKLKMLLNKVDEDKLKDVLKKALNGDLSELRHLSEAYNPNQSSGYNKYFGGVIN